ncbi:hypothetical protein BVIET440_60233 [Burkholderia vietnamiensis]
MLFNKFPKMTSISMFYSFVFLLVEV